MAGQPTFGTLLPALQYKMRTARLQQDGDSSNPSVGWKFVFFKDTPTRHEVKFRVQKFKTKISSQSGIDCKPCASRIVPFRV
jgi:hypothetical protein